MSGPNSNLPLIP